MTEIPKIGEVQYYAKNQQRRFVQDAGGICIDIRTKFVPSDPSKGWEAWVSWGGPYKDIVNAYKAHEEALMRNKSFTPKKGQFCWFKQRHDTQWYGPLMFINMTSEKPQRYVTESFGKSALWENCKDLTQEQKGVI